MGEGRGGGAGGTREAAYFTHVTPKLRGREPLTPGEAQELRGHGLQGVKTR